MTSTIHIDMHNERTMCELIETIDEGDVIDLTKYRADRQTSELDFEVWRWREDVSTLFDQLLTIEDMLTGTEQKEFHRLAKNIVTSPDIKEMKVLLQKILDDRRPDEF